MPVPLDEFPPVPPFKLIVPAITAFPLASIVTGVLVALRVKVTVTPTGMLMVVKLNTPDGGRASVVFVVGLYGPSAPVLPLLNVCADAEPSLRASAASRTKVTSQFSLMIDLLLADE
jgi:hypothetical protein